MEITIDQIIERINELLAYKHWSHYKLAKEAGISMSSLSNIYVRKTFPTIPTLCKICNGFDISLYEFFDFQENPIRSLDFSEDEENLIYQYRCLSKRKKELLTAYITGLNSQ